MRKAVFEVGRYTVTERTCGGWAVYETGAEQPLSFHDTEAAATAAARKLSE